jgi:hypothetical protein
VFDEADSEPATPDIVIRDASAWPGERFPLVLEVKYQQISKVPEPDVVAVTSPLPLNHLAKVALVIAQLPALGASLPRLFAQPPQVVLQ